jgi:hypothetical protein
MLDSSGLAHPKPIPAVPETATAGSAEDAQAAAAAAKSAAAPAKANGAAADARNAEFIAKLFMPPGPGASDAERQAWEESPIADLFYPQDHPCAGLPLDSVSVPVLEEAANGSLSKYLEAIPEVDRQQCHVQGRWPYHVLNTMYGRVDREKPETVQPFLQELAAMPQDPKAYPADIWLPCDGQAGATTMRVYFQGLVSDYVKGLLSGPRCNAS